MTKTIKLKSVPESVFLELCHDVKSAANCSVYVRINIRALSRFSRFVFETRKKRQKLKS